jgi:DNA-binding GntR family transcriptional regulator
MAVVEGPAPEVFLRTRVLEQVKERIISGELPAYARLHERNLSQELGVSRVPVREAIRSLESQGLVEVRPRIGAFVKPLTRKYVQELFDVRLALEPLAASLAAKNRDAEQLEQLERFFQEEKAALEAHDNKAGSLANAEFHLVILRASGNDLLYSIIAPLHSQIQRLFRRTIADISGMLNHDHGELLDAIRNQDAARAARIATEHVSGTRAHSVSLFD